MPESRNKSSSIAWEIIEAIGSEYLPPDDYLRDVTLRTINKHVEMYGKKWVLNHVKWVRNQLKIREDVY